MSPSQAVNGNPGVGTSNGARRPSSSNMLNPRPSNAKSATERERLGFFESESSDLESGNEQQDTADHTGDGNLPRTMHPHRSPSHGPRACTIPRFSRAISMPLPSQLGYLKHPYRSQPLASFEESPSLLPDASRIQELSVELADSVQMMIQTMLQVSPPQLLDPAKEQLSACSLSVPTSSMSAMLTSMKNLNYISANMARLCSRQSPSLDEDTAVKLENRLLDSPAESVDFDLGELLQSVGDSLSGSAAQAGVDLVLYHGNDIDMRHVYVRGDENGTSYALSHVSCQVVKFYCVDVQSFFLVGDSTHLGNHQTW